MTATEGQI